jgi:hypothetical protein
MLEVILQSLLEGGAIGPFILGVAALMWRLGVRDPFILASTALVAGGMLGFAVNRLVANFFVKRYRMRRGSSSRIGLG